MHAYAHNHIRTRATHIREHPGRDVNVCKKVTGKHERFTGQENSQLINARIP